MGARRNYPVKDRLNPGDIITDKLADSVITPVKNPYALQLLASVVMPANAASVTVPWTEDRDWVRIVVLVKGKTGADTIGMRFNADAGNNYCYRYSSNGAADVTAINQTGILVSATSTNMNELIIIDIQNVGWEKKNCSFTSVEGHAKGTAPVRIVGAGMWDTDPKASSVTFYCIGANSLSMYTEILVFGAKIQP